jgi:branched-chain amino acid transport system substrate-binding protein
MIRTVLSTLVIAVTLGVPGIVSAQGKKPYEEIRIGVSQSLTGVLSPYGVSAVDGIQLGADLINAQGGINGMMIKLIIDEEASDKNKALANVQKHIDRDETLAELSPTGTGLAAATGPIANRSKIVIIGTAAGGAASMATGSGPYSFRVSLPDTEIYPVEVKMIAKDIGAKTAALQ